MSHQARPASLIPSAASCQELLAARPAPPTLNSCDSGGDKRKRDGRRVSGGWRPEKKAGDQCRDGGRRGKILVEKRGGWEVVLNLSGVKL